MKTPKTDSAKASLPGDFFIRPADKNHNPTNSVLPLMVYPKTEENMNDQANALQIVYDHGPITNYQWATFSDIRNNIALHWPSSPNLFNPISDELNNKISQVVNNRAVINE